MSATLNIIKQYQIKLLLTICFTLFMLINPLYAGPFLKVDRIDSISEFPKIKVYLTIRNSESIPLLGLDEDNILVYEDGYRVNYVKVKNLSETDSFLYIVYSMDSSKSISKELLLKIKNEASRLLSSSNSNDMIAIYRFNDNVELMNLIKDIKFNFVNKIGSQIVEVVIKSLIILRCQNEYRQ